MRAVVQRVEKAEVTVGDDTVSHIGRGLLVLVGAGHTDGERDCAALADKLVGLRIFPDDAGKMNRSVADLGAEVLIVSQFTLLADVRKGRRPAFTRAAPPEQAEPLVAAVARLVTERGVRCQSGIFGAKMRVSLVNSGPVTLVIDVVNGRVL